MVCATSGKAQTIWECRWGRPGYLPHGVVEPCWPDGLWVCVRPTPKTVRRPVTEQECATCHRWQAASSQED